MRRFRTGQQVVLRAAVRRNRRHKYGPVRLRKGRSGRVVQRHSKLLKAPRYDVSFSRGQGRGRTVRKLPAASLRRPRNPFLILLVVLALLLIIGYLTQQAAP